MIDLDGAAELFAAATDLTVGLEEEFALLDPVTLDLVPRFEELRDSAGRQSAELAEHIAGELISSEIEVISGRGANLRDAIERQRELRRQLFAHAANHGVALGATATHPWADYREQRIIDTEHYRRVEEGLKYVAWRNNTFSLHVHVGVRDADRAIGVCDRLRPVLPLLLALSASSPFIDGRPSGLHSTRSQIFTRCFPRCGVPEAFGDWASYRQYVDLLFATASIVEFTQVWWSIRPHFAFGTVEVRICDMQTTAGDSEALAALIVSCVAQALRDQDENVPYTDLPGRLIEENMWRAIRHGLDGQMIDFDSGEQYPSAQIAERLLAWTAPVRAELDIEPMLPERNSAQRQRAMVDAGAAPYEVYDTTVRETRATFAEEVTA